MKSKALQFLIIFLIHEQPVQAKTTAKPHSAWKPSITRTIASANVMPQTEKH